MVDNISITWGLALRIASFNCFAIGSMNTPFWGYQMILKKMRALCFLRGMVRIESTVANASFWGYTKAFYRRGKKNVK